MDEDDRRKGLDLRRRANDALKAQQPHKAVELFTKALLEPSAFDRPEHVAALYCGRASAYVGLCGYDFAVLDAYEALKFHENSSRAVEWLGIARRRQKYFKLAAEDYMMAAKSSKDVNYKSRMNAEAERMKQAEVENIEAENSNRTFLEFDFEQARIECEVRGDDLSKNMISRTLLQAFHKIDDAWGRFYREWNSEDWVLEPLILILETVAREPRAVHFTCRSVSKDQLMATLDLFLNQHPLPFEPDSIQHYASLLTKLGPSGPTGVKVLVKKWIVAKLLENLRAMSQEGNHAQALASFCTISDAYPTLSKDKLLNNQFAVVIPLWNLIIFCAQGVLTRGVRIESKMLRDYVVSLTTITSRSQEEELETVRQGDPLLYLSHRRCCARAYLVRALFARSDAEMRNVDFVNESESVMFPSKKLLQNAYDYAKKASSLFHEDDEGKAQAEVLALYCQMTSKGGKMRDILSTVAQLQCLRDRSEKFFGQYAQFDVSDDAVRRMLKHLPETRRGAETRFAHARLHSPPKTLDDFLNLRIRPAGILLVDQSDKDGRRPFSSDAVRYIDRQPGDLSVWIPVTVLHFSKAI